MDNIAAKVKSITGKAQNIFSFTTSAAVNADTMVKILVGKEWAGRTVSLNSYNNDKNVYETVATNLVVDSDGYIIAKVNPSTNYFVTDAQNLPQTGSPIDMGLLINFGVAISGLGALILMLEKKKKTNCCIITQIKK